MNINNEKIVQLKKGLLIDCREVNEWNEGHLPNAINAPLVGLTNNPDQFLTEGKNETYYIYCLSGGRASRACSVLNQNGYDVVNIGGIMEYTGTIKK